MVRLTALVPLCEAVNLSCCLERRFAMSIQWFPGHMNAARKEAAKTMEAIDVIVEVLDARVPQASCNPLIE